MMQTTQNRPDFAAQRMAAQRFRERYEALAAQGIRPVIITRSGNPEQWKAWLAAHRAAGRMASVELMLERGEATVPCLNPHDFDLPEAAPDRRVKD